MKRVYRWVFFLLIPGLVLSFVAGNEVLSKIGCSDDEARNTITDNFIFGYLHAPSCGGVYKKIPASERVAVVNMLYSYIRSVVASEGFKKRYQEEHEANKPQEPEKEQVVKMDDAQAQIIKALEDQLNNPYLDAAQKAEMQKSIDEMKKQMTQPEMQQQLAQADEMTAKGAEEKYQQDMAKYKSDLAEWEKMNDVNLMIKTRLEDFLKLTSDIDFNAKLVQAGKMMKFENPAYESKNNMWKACYRCGPETIRQARIKAEEWLKELK